MPGNPIYSFKKFYLKKERENTYKEKIKGKTKIAHMSLQPAPEPQGLLLPPSHAHLCEGKNRNRNKHTCMKNSNIYRTLDS
jgi:hypothetical protein